MMKWIASRLVPAILIGSNTYCQVSQGPVAFEVASMKAVPPPLSWVGIRQGCFGGPGTSDPGRYVCEYAKIGVLILQAYDLKAYQLPPSALADSTLYSVNAKVPPGATTAQVREMLQTLLRERLKLEFHFEHRPMDVYHLVVAPGGLRVKESGSEPPSADRKQSSGQSSGATDEEGFLITVPPPHSLTGGTANGKVRMVGTGVPLGGSFIHDLGYQLGRPVLDATGLNSNYDFTLTFASPRLSGANSDGDGGGMTIFTALEKQMGLKLAKTQDLIDMVVIDHFEKTPTEN